MVSKAKPKHQDCSVTFATCSTYMTRKIVLRKHPRISKSRHLSWINDLPPPSTKIHPTITNIHIMEELGVLRDLIVIIVKVKAQKVSYYLWQLPHNFVLNIQFSIWPSDRRLHRRSNLLSGASIWFFLKYFLSSYHRCQFLQIVFSFSYLCLRVTVIPSPNEICFNKKCVSYS